MSIEREGWGEEGFRCRRCESPIPPGGTLHLVRRHIWELPHLSQLMTSIGVCDGCLGEGERGYDENPRPYRYTPPPIELQPAQLNVLLAAAVEGVVYRRPKTICLMLGQKPSADDPQVTTAGYELFHLGFIEWTPAPTKKRGTPLPTAYAKITDKGREYLQREGVPVAEGNVDTSTV